MAILRLLKDLQIDPATCDVLLIGDGSGSRWGRGAGWACVLLEVQTGVHKFFSGALNNGTVSVAEILPYLHSLLWYEAESTQRLRRRVHIVTDSQYAQAIGARKSRAGVKKHRLLWQYFDWLSRARFEFTWHWRARDSSVLNQFADWAGREARLALEAERKNAAKVLHCSKTGYSIRERS